MNLANILIYEAFNSLYRDSEGVFFGDTGPIDRLEAIRNIARRRLAENREQAIAEGYVDAEGNFLDVRKTVFGRPNPNYGKPLGSKHDWYRTVWGATMLGERIRLDLYGDNASFDIPLWEPLSFNAIRKSSLRDFSVFRASRFSSFDAQILPEGEREARLEKCRSSYPKYGLKELFSSDIFSALPKFPVFISAIIAVVKETEFSNLVLLYSKELDWDERGMMFLPKETKLEEDIEVLIFGFPSKLTNFGAERRLVIKPLGVKKLGVA